MTIQKVRSYAYRLLAMRSYPSSVMRVKLERKGFETALCDQVIAELQAQGYINDAEFSAQAVKRAVERGYGPRYIAQKFQLQGVDVKEDVCAISEEMQREQIQKLLGKRRLHREKAIRMLERRGFSLGIIFQEVEKFY